MKQKLETYNNIENILNSDKKFNSYKSEMTNEYLNLTQKSLINLSIK